MIARIGPAFGVATLWLLAGAAQAHDLWPRPSTFLATPEELVSVELELDDGTGRRELLARPASPPLARFEAVGPEKATIPLLGAVGRRPAGLWRPSATRSDQPETWILVYENSPREHTLEASAFGRYLEEEGLDDARRRREERGETSLAARELWSRHSKALVVVTPKRDPEPDTAESQTPRDQVLGLELELVLEQLDAEGLVLRVLRRGTPVEAALVDLHDFAGGAMEQARSDATGRVHFACRLGALAATTTTLEPPEAPTDPWRGHFAALSLRADQPCPSPSQ